MITRYLKAYIEKDALAKGKMAFVTGPRQVGKSTLAQSIINNSENYFLYDDETFRKGWAKSPNQAIELRGAGPIVLDEIHKDRKWKTKIKGIYDLKGKEIPIIVTGSARFSFYRKGGDSLLGRYFPYRLHPFSVAESEDPLGIAELFEHSPSVNYPWQDLLSLGGFPEPLLGGNVMDAKRWSRLRLDRLIAEDSRDFRNISDLNAFRVLTDLLPERVGSLLSINALYQNVGKAYATVRDWMNILDILYYCFTIKPYSKKLSRALRAEPKFFLYDILQIPESKESARLENITALHLLKACQFWTDTAQDDFDLRFVRNKEGIEVDFLLLRNQKPWMLVECKSNQKQPSKQLIYFAGYLKPAYSFQLVTDQAYDREFPEYKTRVMGYEKFFSHWV